MPYLYLILSVVFVAAGNVCGGFYARKTVDDVEPTPLYNLLMMGTACLGWLIAFLFDRSFDARVLFYALPAGICFSAAIYANIAALKYGPVSLTSLFMQLSLILVTIWGFFFWDAAVTVWSVLGLIFTVCAIVLCLLEKKENKEAVEPKKKSEKTKWLVFAVTMTFANATSSILQKTQQMNFDGKYGSLFMLIVCGVGLIAFAAMYLASDKTHSVRILKRCAWVPCVHGVTNFGLNVFVVLLATSTISPALVYPVISVGGLAVGLAASVLLFREKLSVRQWIGIAIGVVAVLLLSV